MILGSITPAPRRSWIASKEDVHITEEINPRTLDLDTMDTLEILERMNSEDSLVPEAVAQALPSVERAIEGISARMRAGGRLIYLGAGTSGRLGVLDASECPPTFNTGPGQVLGIIAGGDQALHSAVEKVEDRRELGSADLRAVQIQAKDSVVGLSASGNTPYVISGLRYAHEIGALTVGIACNRPALISQEAELSILIQVGPEVISGSTRLKAGTAQKMVLNMISTAVMVKLGKTYGNLMVDVKASNAKLRRRASRLVQKIAGLDEEKARELLEACGWVVKTAVVSHWLQLDPEGARRVLASHQGNLRSVLETGQAD